MKNIDRVCKVYGAKCINIHVILIMATGNKWYGKMFVSFLYRDSLLQFLTILLRIFEPLAIVCGCTARFVSDLIVYPKDIFRHDASHTKMSIK